MIKSYIQVFFLGILSSFSLPYFSFFPLIVVGFICFLIKLNKLTKPKKGFIYGLIFGFGYFLIGFHWIVFPLFFDRSHIVLVPFVLLFFPLLLSNFFAISSYLVIYLKNKNFFNLGFFSSSLLIALLFFSFEILRSTIFGGLPWNLFGHIWEIDYRFTIITKFIGVFGLSFLTIFWMVILSNYLLNRKIKQSIILFIFFPLFLFFSGKVLETSISGKKITVRIVQPNISQELKWSKQHIKDNIKILLDLSSIKTQNKNPEIIIWPEVALPYFLNENKELVNIISNSIPKGTILITGALMRLKKENDKQIYNSLYVLKDYEISQIYNKLKLVPFGEFIPFRNYIPIKKITYGTQDFSSGSSRKNIFLNTKSGSFYFEPSICFEGIFPKKRISDVNPFFLVNITNDAWFGSTTGPSQHLAISRLRAVERGSPLIRVANSGISAIFDHNGKKLKHLSLNTRGYIDFELNINNVDTHYSNFGMYALLHLIFLLVLFSFIVDNFKRNKY